MIIIDILGIEFHKQKLYNEALVYYEKVIQINPKCVTALNNIGMNNK